MGPTTVIKCRECGQSDRANYTDPPRGRMLADQLCFKCLYWIEIIEGLSRPDIAIAGGRYYVIHPMSSQPGRQRGFGGDLFTFRFADGRLVTSNDVWNGSPVPEHFRSRLPDNAAIVPQGRTRA